ncbi:MAG: hypothetical protein COV08_01235 [Candidatus Vogelbacteria bacterium CG10_big_fil_rev_8_21_14_0_10_49_38]|uniref:TGS domain-containing protein n=1 Tax=Candidatus Vogelbacteria bacterium CG10_big_fil_rev_8_21_14_0_10_49_38 TaxID=1975043 RepID=A0A2H0RI44_9BACT|nr:MAG: hypothetical protein BK006_01255 [bacterium CG10_49_38]PIR46163.1 MAG: hypothetical protein COV08_01235 [Candidatus Vogelbacteria bacterium CG10_big_fil_rev_8_21_14_0_10_49_38]
MNPKEIIGLLKRVNQEDARLIERAFAFAKQAHEGQARLSGEPYLIHPFNVALNLAELQMDAVTIAAGLLHDTIEDTATTAKKLEENFGAEIAFLVEGVTKLGKLKYRGGQRHAESLRKLFVAMAEDMRVIVIRLADRLHNVRTLQHLPKEKQIRVALETLEIYAPLANRLGIWRLKGMLEDASFPYVYPEEYKKVVALRKTKGKETTKRLEKIYRALERELAARKIKTHSIDYRVKYLYSLYTKLLRKGMDIEEIYDISALRVIVETTDECYQVLGVIHNLWRPVPDRLKDYIANPKPNGYQSIHTSIFTGDGQAVEIQIRTSQMQHEAELGIASHFVYDEIAKKQSSPKLAKNIAWVKELLAWRQDRGQGKKFINDLKGKLAKDNIFVFTPKGEVVELPAGSSPIDFAYAIHSDIGNHASGVKINQKMSPLSSRLKSDDIVEIIVNKKSHPTVKWLNYARTTVAKRHIKNFLLEQEGEVGATSETKN